MTSPDLGTSTGKTAAEPSENQLGEMHIRRQGSRLPIIYPHSRRNQTWQNKLKAIQTAKAPADVKTIRSLVGLCNFFRTHIKDFAVIAAPLFKLTCKDSGYKGGPLPESAMDAFFNLSSSQSR
jgi:hypothetical protein